MRWDDKNGEYIMISWVLRVVIPQSASMMLVSDILTAAGSSLVMLATPIAASARSSTFELSSWWQKTRSVPVSNSAWVQKR